ncbi:Uncharacterized protein TCM_036422 [Theobroma cacao]|uniref:Uncharacterized protein n=1 Tax=Theobroma cacao TaxID=3641 RepID=A0A061FRY6_THECC|nr:Uncharacterized protein TCM_036422 [Theobroma cacao]
MCFNVLMHTNDEDLVHEIEDELENNWKILNAKRMKSFPILQRSVRQNEWHQWR